MELEKRIEVNVKEIVKDVREYFRNQKDDWQKIPWLALQADGRDGFGGGNTEPYMYGIEVIDDRLGVDLETGELVSSLFYDFSDMGLAGDKSVLGLSFLLKNYNAKKIIRKLEEEGKKEHKSFVNYGEFATAQEWRSSEIEKYGLEKEKYVRRKICGMKIMHII